MNPGNAYMIYGGMPHAIRIGCFLMEVQEPTGYTMWVEKVTPARLTISDELIYLGVGEQNILDCFHYEGCSYEKAIKISEGFAQLPLMKWHLYFPSLHLLVPNVALALNYFEKL
ncbi:hypothetical protein [Maribacter ulvicola]|uniref:hypothetical protein n=1 Tax=Maribacter ulvicola TaxID=228959 RepID=UPI000971384D|nr:hypothetical protein [Maribacter ulvicola]